MLPMWTPSKRSVILCSIAQIKVKLHTACCGLLWTTNYDTHNGEKQACVIAETGKARVRRIIQIQGR